MSKDCKKKTWITVEEPSEKIDTNATPIGESKTESLEQDGDNPYYSCIGDDEEYDEYGDRVLMIACLMVAIVAVLGIVATIYGGVRLIRRLCAKKRQSIN